MCGRYGLYDTDAKALETRFELKEQPTFVSQDNYNVSPMQRMPIIYEEDGKRVAQLMQWGFIPFFAKDPRGFRPINTVSETAFEKPMWREAMKHHRCLVPSRGFYEWKKFFGDNGKIERKVPYFIHPKDIDLFAFAGIYSIWKDVEGLPFYTFSIMTTTPNEEMEDIHNRMPVILRPGQEASWLNPEYSEEKQLADLLVPYPDGMLEIYRVSDDVNSARNNDKHLVEAVA